MKPIVYNIYILMMLMAYVIRRAGTFSMDEKVRMLEFITTMALNPEIEIVHLLDVPFLGS